MVYGVIDVIYFVPVDIIWQFHLLGEYSCTHRKIIFICSCNGKCWMKLFYQYVLWGVFLQNKKNRRRSRKLMVTLVRFRTLPSSLLFIETAFKEAELTQRMCLYRGSTNTNYWINTKRESCCTCHQEDRTSISTYHYLCNRHWQITKRLIHKATWKFNWKFQSMGPSEFKSETGIPGMHW